MIRQKKYLFTVLVVVAIILLVSGCQKQGKLDEGDCKLELELSGMPESFEDLPDSLKELFEIEVTLKNVSNKKEYTLHLNKGNDFKYEAKLNPGIYQVEKCIEYHYKIFQFTPEIRSDSVTLQKGKKAEKLLVTITDTKEFDQYIKNTKPSKKVMGLDLFSRKIQIDGHIIPMEDILKKDLSIFHDMKTPFKDISVEPNKSYTVSGNGINVKVFNTSSKTLEVAKCKVLSVEVTKNIAVMPQGVRFGLSLKEVCNAENGLYKTPDKCKGSLILAYELDDMTCIYNDPSSGDKVSINFNCNGWYVDHIKYQFEVYE